MTLRATASTPCRGGPFGLVGRLRPSGRDEISRIAQRIRQRIGAERLAGARALLLAPAAACAVRARRYRRAGRSAARRRPDRPLRPAGSRSRSAAVAASYQAQR